MKKNLGISLILISLCLYSLSLYALPQGAIADDVDIAISIYDASGRLIRTLNIGYQPEGFYITKDKAAYWDGRNEAGERVASGIYFYNIQAGDFTAEKKMIISR